MSAFEVWLGRREDGKCTGEVDGAVVVGVDLVDHVLQLGLCGVLPK